MAGDLQGAAGAKVAKCDFCEERHPFLYCKADSARLCLACDHHVHSANPLSLKHLRAPLCECCQKRVATLQCEEETRFFCAACEEEQGAHDGEGHTVVKAISFTGCISPGQIASAWKCHAPLSSFLDAFVPSKSAVIEKACWPSDGSLSGILASYWTSSLDSILSSEANSCFADESGSLYQHLGGQKQVLLEQLEQLQRLQTEIDGFVPGMQHECMALSPKQFFGPFEIIEGQSNADAQRQQEAVDEDKLSYSTSYHANKASWNFSAARKIPDTKVLTGYDSCELLSEAHRRLLLNDTDELLRTIPQMSMLVGTDNATCSRIEEQHFSAPHPNMLKMDRLKPGASQNPTSGASVPVCANLSKISSREAMEDVPSPGIQGSDLQVQHKSTSGRSYAFLNSGVSLANGVGTPSSLDIEASAQARDSAVIRYKEKKKSRNFDKFVRYESRKARAETRLRVRGRFVKANGLNPEYLLADGIG